MVSLFAADALYSEMERSKRKYKPPARFKDFQTDFKTAEANPAVLNISITPHLQDQLNSTNESTSG